MGGIDKNDAIISTCSSCRKILKWTTKVVIHMIEEAILNAFILYNKTLLGKRAIFNKSTHFLELIPPAPKKVNPRGRCVVS